MTEELFSSESVASAILTNCAMQLAMRLLMLPAVDKNARVAVETSVKGGPEKGLSCSLEKLHLLESILTMKELPENCSRNWL